MTLKPGDEVSFLDETGTATVVSITGHTAIVLTDEGFEIEYPISKLVARPKLLAKDILNAPVTQKDAAIRTTGSKQPPKSDVLEVDLHLHEIAEHYRGFTRHDMVTYQLNHARNQFFKARKAGIKKIIFIHGVGEGVLKQELRKMLSAFDGITVYDADYSKYGQGATAVEIWKRSED
ncbi:MAG: Smr/MutS family protein [Thermaurantimonas sp.]|uniref:Smr/MutS family protein n=1 Tax=Thermaurantimonas sp. TaxID=2681568 RepID=UPI00391AF3EC